MNTSLLNTFPTLYLINHPILYTVRGLEDIDKVTEKGQQNLAQVEEREEGQKRGRGGGQQSFPATYHHSPSRSLSSSVLTNILKIHPCMHLICKNTTANLQTLLDACMVSKQALCMSFDTNKTCRGHHTLQDPQC